MVSGKKMGRLLLSYLAKRLVNIFSSRENMMQQTQGVQIVQRTQRAQSIHLVQMGHAQTRSQSGFEKITGMIQNEQNLDTGSLLFALRHRHRSIAVLLILHGANVTA